MGRRDWSKAALKRQGFVGWHPFCDLGTHLPEIDWKAGGNYVVYRTTSAPPRFLKKNPGGTWRGDPTVSLPALRQNWVSGAHVLNIGRAIPGQLRKRLRAYKSFGEGRQARHSGGRLIWQLADAWECLVAWRVAIEGEDPIAIETTMLAAFKEAYGNRPFANDPHLLDT